MNPTAAVPASILRHRPFVFYWSARTCAAMGYQMLGVAVAWQMYALTGSAFDLGLVGLTMFLPAAAFMLVAGQIADRYDRRRLLQIWQTVEGLAAGRNMVRPTRPKSNALPVSAYICQATATPSIW
jgi:MFS family permease